MKKLITILLALAMLAPCAFAEEASLRVGYLTQLDGEDGWYSLCAGAFAYAAEQQGAEPTIMTYDPTPEEIPEDAESEEEPPQPGTAELMALIESGVDGIVLVPASLEQAQALIALANEAGVPIAIEGLDVSPAYPPEPEATLAPEETPSPDPTPDPAELRPYVAAVGYGDEAAYAACKWLEDDAYSPALFHCILPGSDASIQSGMRRALANAQWLTLSVEMDATEDSVSAGHKAFDAAVDTYALFGCVLADTPALAEGCMEAVRGADLDWPVALASNDPEALALLQRGGVDMVASAPAAVEGVQAFKALYDFLTEEIRPEAGYVRLSAITSTPANTSLWIANDDYEAAYELAFPEIEEAESAG